MHQTFYIDIDEEITSIIERLRASRAKEVVIVVPKRALLIQSIINLKLLKKEADRLGQEVIIVTQDKIGKMMVEKTGIQVEQKIDDIAGDEILVPAREMDNGESALENKERGQSAGRGKNVRDLSQIGSDAFFDQRSVARASRQEVRRTPAEADDEDAPEQLLNKELVTGISADMRGKKSVPEEARMESYSSVDLVRNMDIRQRTSDDLEKAISSRVPLAQPAKKVAQKGRAIKNIFAPKKEQVSLDQGTEAFFQTDDLETDWRKSKQEKETKAKKATRSREQVSPEVKLPSRAWRYFLIFFVVAAALIGLALAYLFLPKAEITIYSKARTKSLDAEVVANTKVSTVDLDKKVIPGQLVTASTEFSANFEATGQKTASSHKARGKITIYNEYSSAPQPLVATTRFLSTDGKIFRLVSGVTVPGMTGADPGAIEADVVADEAGEQFNIGPTSFTIPGFQGSGSEKYSKFYAKSAKAMTGGGQGTEMVRSISEADVSAAKNKLLLGLNDVAKQKIKEQAGDSRVILDDAVTVSDIVYKFSNSVGEITDNFTATISARVSALVFSEGDLRNVVGKLITKGNDSGMKTDENSLTLDFGKGDLDLAEGVLTVRVHGITKLLPNIDLENIKKGVLGKEDTDLEAYLRSYSDIAKVEVSYWPTFVNGRIPLYESRVTVTLDNN